MRLLAAFIFLPLALFGRIVDCGEKECVIKHFHLGADGYSEESHIHGDDHNPDERSPDEVDFVSETPPVFLEYQECGSQCHERLRWSERDQEADWPTKQEYNILQG